jgi:phosphoglucomutase
MYVEYGLFREKLISITKKGKEGAEEIAAMMERFRTSPPDSLGGSQVVTVKDYGARTEKNIPDGTSLAIDLPSSNVLQFVTADGSIISARPSGTEPKIKFYCSTSGELTDRSAYREASERLDRKIDTLLADLGVT